MSSAFFINLICQLFFKQTGKKTQKGVSKNLPEHSKSTMAIHVAPFAISWVQMTNSSLLPAKAALSLGTCLVALPTPNPCPVRITSSSAQLPWAAVVSHHISVS